MTHTARRRPAPITLAMVTAAVLLGLATVHAHAQTTLTQPLNQPPATTEVSGSTTQGKASGLPFLNGGGGSEERADMDKRAAEFPLKLVLSAGKGEYIVAETLSLSNAQGEVLQVKQAGPVVRVKPAPGTYTLEVVYQGKTQRRNVKFAGKGQTVSMRFPG